MDGSFGRKTATPFPHPIGMREWGSRANFKLKYYTIHLPVSCMAFSLFSTFSIISIVKLRPFCVTRCALCEKNTTSDTRCPMARLRLFYLPTSIPSVVGCCRQHRVRRYFSVFNQWLNFPISTAFVSFESFVVKNSSFHRHSISNLCKSC